MTRFSRFVAWLSAVLVPVCLVLGGAFIGSGHVVSGIAVLVNGVTFALSASSMFRSARVLDEVPRG